MNTPPPFDVFCGIKDSDVDVVSFYRYEAHLIFSNRNRISFSAPFRFCGKELLSKTPLINFPLTESNLVRVLGCQVKELECDEDGTLELQFSNGDLLIVYANNPAYEAYSLWVAGQEYIV